MTDALSHARIGVQACIDHGHYLDVDDATDDLAAARKSAKA